MCACMHACVCVCVFMEELEANTNDGYCCDWATRWRKCIPWHVINHVGLQVKVGRFQNNTKQCKRALILIRQYEKYCTCVNFQSK